MDMVDDHHILYSGSYNTLTYQLPPPFPAQRSNPQTASNTTPPSPLVARPVICYDVHCQTQIPTHGIHILFIWVVNAIRYLSSLSFPRQGPVRCSTTDVQYRLSLLLPRSSPVRSGVYFGGTRNARGRLGDAFRRHYTLPYSGTRNTF